jgi:hypothetical protein
MFAIDYDGTIADTNTVKSRWIRQNLGRDLPPYFCDHSTCRPLVGEEVHQRMSAEVYTAQVTAEAPPVPGAIAAVRALASLAPVRVVTVRHGEELEWAWDWLRRQGVAGCIDQMVCAKGKNKVAVAREIGCRIMIDDDLRHLPTDVAQGMLLIHLRSGIPEHHRTISEGVVLCAKWEDAVALAIEFARI